MSKRGENIYKRKDGRFEGRFVKERDNNKITEYGFVYGSSYSDVKIKMNKAIRNIDSPVKSKKEIFVDAVEKWINSKSSIKSSTQYNYTCIFRSSIKPYFKSKRLMDITDNDMVNFLNHLHHKELSNKRIRDIMVVLKQYFKHNKININVEYPKLKKKRLDILTDSEIKKLQRMLNKDDIKDFSILIALYTGLRIGELCALKWKHINIIDSEISIENTISRVKNEGAQNSDLKTKVILDSPKTDNSIRIIPIHNKILNQLSKLKAKQEDNNFILTGTDTFMSYNSLYNHFKRKLREFGIKKYNFHVLRHTFASRALISGMDVKALSEILGHATVKITLDRYVHIAQEEKLNQMNKISITKKRTKKRKK